MAVPLSRPSVTAQAPDLGLGRDLNPLILNLFGLDARWNGWFKVVFTPFNHTLTPESTATSTSASASTKRNARGAATLPKLRSYLTECRAGLWRRQR